MRLQDDITIAAEDREDPPAVDEQPAAAGPRAAALFTAMSANLAERAADLGALEAAGMR